MFLSTTGSLNQVQSGESQVNSLDKLSLPLLLFRIESTESKIHAPCMLRNRLQHSRSLAKTPNATEEPELICKNCVDLEKESPIVVVIHHKVPISTLVTAES